MFRAHWILVVAVFVAAAAERLELNGQIEPALGKAFVAIYGVATPFTDNTLSGPKGRFRFRNLAPGSYTLAIFLPGYGEVHRTVELTRGRADANGRVSVTVPFAPTRASAVRSLRERGTVSARDLAIPPRARSEYDAAQRDLARRDTESAARRLKRAVELAPWFMAAWNDLGTIACQTDRHDEAETYFRKAIEQEPGAFYPVMNLGGVLVKLRRFEEALKYNLYAVEQEPEDALANSQLGVNYFFLEDFDKAMKFLMEAKRLDPGHFTLPQLYLAEIYERRGDVEAAVGELQEYLDQRPDGPEAAVVREKLDEFRGPAKGGQ